MSLLARLFRGRWSWKTPVEFPRVYDLNNPVHVMLLDEVRTKYATLMSDESREFAGCMYRPASLLPYPRMEIRRALSALLECAEGRRESGILDRAVRNEEFAEQLRVCLRFLEFYLDVPAETLPRDPVENAMAGARLVRERKSTTE